MHNSIEPTDCIQRLRTLPSETLPPYNWQEFQRRARRRTAPARFASDWRPLAAAAALLLFVCAIAVWGRFGGGGRHVVVASGAVEDGTAVWAHGSESATAADGGSLPQADSAAADHGSQGQVNGSALDGWWRARTNGSGLDHGWHARANESTVARSIAQASEPAANRATAQAGGSTADRATAQAGGSTANRAIAQASEMAADRSTAQPSESAADRSWQTAANGAAARSTDRDFAQGGAVGPTPATVAGQTPSESAVANRRSRALESWLAALPQEPAVVRVGTRAAVAGLEDRIAQVDDLMTSMRIEGMSGDRLADLQRERLRLVGSLAQVRYAEVVASASP